MKNDQHNFSSSYSQMFDLDIRVKKSKKAINVIKDHLHELKDLNLLEFIFFNKFGGSHFFEET